MKRRPITKLSDEYIGCVVSDASGGGPVLNGVIVGTNQEILQYRVAVKGEIVNRPPSKLLILADSVTDHVANAVNSLRDARDGQLRQLAKDLNVLGRENNIEDEVREALTSNGVKPASELYRVRMDITVFVDVRPNSTNAFDKLGVAAEEANHADALAWLTNSIKVTTEDLRNGSSEGGYLYVEPDGDFQFEALSVDLKRVTSVVDFGE
jgi:hypothetical protein